MPRKCPKGTLCIEIYTIIFICILIFTIGYFIYKQRGCLFCSNVKCIYQCIYLLRPIKLIQYQI